MNENYLKKLEFYNILKILSDFCITYMGKELSLNLMPYNKKEVVRNLLEETKEAVNLIYRNSTPSFYDIKKIDIDLKNLEIGNTLSISSLLNLTNILILSIQLKEYFNKEYIESENFPILSNLFTILYSNKNIIDQIKYCITDEKTIADKASKELNTIRRQKRKLEQNIKDKLNEIIHSSKYSKYIQENIITIRNDRYVIPIKEEHRMQIKGFIHDISNGGSTVFIEPLPVFEMNNEINQLKIEEELEIEKILKQLSILFVPYINELENNIEIIGKLDFVFAKAKYSKSIDGITPLINEDKYIDFKNARHPLIDKAKVVPISLSLGNNISCLLITGPNTGGKTVTLKTVGLLTCMACSGLNIPCDENSSIYVFENIFADIGDDQSIENSLSTFSSHILNIVEIIRYANDNSLILIDELGSGTDPLEGANLAISILEYFKKTSCLSLVTTHYQELKQYALISDGFENASVEFDIDTLSPTYKLLVGIPGKSNAFEISKKLGLKDEIIKKAKSLLDTQSINIEELLKNIYDDKITIEKEKDEIQKELKQVTLLKKSLENDNTILKEKQQNLVNSAMLEARDILLNAKDEADLVIKNLKQANSTKDLNNLRNGLNKKIKTIKIENNIESIRNHIDVSDVKLNTHVLVTNLNQNGIIVSNLSKSNEVQVQIGSMKINVNIKNLIKLNDTPTTKKSKNISNYSSISKSRNAKVEINVIGYNIEDANFVIDKFLDDSYLSKLQTIHIVHGKGTGKLKSGIHTFLKSHPHVKSFRMGAFGEGEMGVTVVELKI